jgi:hypothetical protein
MAVGGTEETTLGIQCWPQRRLLPFAVVSPAEQLRLPQDKEGQRQKFSNQFMLLFVSLLRVLSNLCTR